MMYANPQKQEGMVLLASLMLLVVMTLLTFATSRSVLLQEKMTSATRDNILTMEAAEAAIREAESLAANPQTVFTTNGGTGGVYDGDCDTSESDCFINVVSQYADGLFDDAFWNRSTTATVGVSCGDNCTLTGQFVVVRLGEIDMTLASEDEIIVITNHYQDQNESTSGKVYKYKVIVRAQGQNPNHEKVIVSYFAATSGA